MRYKNILIVALITLAILLIPLALQLTISTGIDGQGWNWTLSDFIIIGILIFLTGLAIDFARRKAGKYKTPAIITIIILFLLIYGQMAVQWFTNLIN